jgi:hypothetical protein
MAESGRKEGEREEPPMAQVARYSGLGLQLAGSVVLFMLAGSWADGKLGTDRWLALIGALLGGAIGFYSLYRNVMRDQDRDPPKP